MKDKFITAFEAVLATNKGGEVRNLLITDNDEAFLDEALYQLRYWCVINGFNLIELDEKDDSWLPEIQSRELFDKLNQPNTVLMIKNYATVNFHSVDENTPRNFLRDAVVNRHYGCGNDFVPSDDLPNLMFVVAINDLTEMRWRKEEYELFTVKHKDDGKKAWTNTKFSVISSKMHPVMSAVNLISFWVSDDETNLCFNIGEAFGRPRRRRPIRSYSADERTEAIHTFLESNLPDFYDRVENLILKVERVSAGNFVIDVERLKTIFPNLVCVFFDETIEIANADGIRVFDAFELGERSFKLAQAGDIERANELIRDLWALDYRWAWFFREVAKDYYGKAEEHPKGMDHLFHIYLLGWYNRNEKDTWRDGLRNEREYIDSCFSEILYGADDIKASSIVFSMAGCEFCGIPYEELLEISVKVISDYLSVKDNLTVFIAVMNDNIYNFVQSSYQGYCISSSQLKQAILCQSLEYKIEHLDYQFVDLLNVYIHRAGLSPVQCYSAAGIDKKLFSKIKNQRNYKPSKITIIKFAFALHLSLDETQQLLRTCGYILSESIIDDVIIMHYLSQRIYCLEDVDKEIKERSL